jgi:hypothetical protein
MVAISACGGGSDGAAVTRGNQWITYTGNTSMATIDSTNAKILTIDTYSNMDQIKGNKENLDDLLRVLTSLASSYSECGGSYSERRESSTSGTAEFSNFCVMTGGDQIILDGEVYVSDSGQTKILKMSGFSLSVNGIEYSVSASFEMNGSSISMDFVGIDGKTYRIEDFEVRDSYQVSGGVDIVSGRFYHPDYGYVDMYSSSPIVSETCDNILRPTSGNVVITGANETDASVEYQGCADFTVCTNQDAMCSTYQW